MSLRERIYSIDIDDFAYNLTDQEKIEHYAKIMDFDKSKSVEELGLTCNGFIFSGDIGRIEELFNKIDNWVNVDPTICKDICCSDLELVIKHWKCFVCIKGEEQSRFNIGFDWIDAIRNTLTTNLNTSEPVFPDPRVKDFIRGMRSSASLDYRLDNLSQEGKHIQMQLWEPIDGGFEVHIGKLCLYPAPAIFSLNKRVIMTKSTT